MSGVAKAYVVEHFCTLYQELYDLIRGMQVGEVNLWTEDIPSTARSWWPFAAFFQEMMRNTVVDCRTARWQEVLNVSARTNVSMEVEDMLGSWMRTIMDGDLDQGRFTAAISRG